MPALRNSYPCIRRGDDVSWGGSQAWASREELRRWGCGVVAAADLLLYLRLFHPGCQAGLFRDITGPRLSWEEYEPLLCRLWREDLPLIPGFGINGWGLALGLERYFCRYGLPLSASWGVSGSRLWERMEDMLSRDFPVILGVGPNFPALWRQSRLPLCRRTEDGFRFACRVKGHFVTAVGMEDGWLRLSSWGKEYWLRQEDYENYVRRHSGFMVSNLLFIRRKNG